MIKAIPVAVLLSQISTAPPTEWWTPLVNAGAMGAVLLYFMWQFSKKEDERNQSLKDVAKAINSNTQGMMVVVLTLKNLDENVKDMARKIADDTKPA